MTASFAGAAAAATNSNYETGPTFTDDTIDKDVYIGQDITLDGADAHAHDLVSIVPGPDSSSDSDAAVTSEVNTAGEVTFETDSLEEDRYYHIRVHGNTEADFGFEGETFQAVSENFEASFSSSLTPVDGTVDVEIDSDRSSQWLNVSSEDFDDDEIESLFEDSATVYDDHDDDGVILEDIGGDEDLEANFGNLEDTPDTGEYEFDFNVTDSVASDNATIELSDADKDYYFGNVDSISEGEIANITIGVEHGDEATVVLGDEEDGFQTSVDLHEIDTDEVVLQFNAHEADGSGPHFGWSVHDDYEDNASIDNAEVNDNELDGEPLPAHNWDLSIGDEIDSGFDLNEEYDRDVLVITERSDIGDASLHTAPKDDNLNSFEDFEDTNVTETSTVADEDYLIVTVEDFGVEGAIDAGYDNAEIGIEQQDAGPIGNAASWNTSADDDDAADLSNHVELINDGDDYNGDLIYVIDYENAPDDDGTSIDPDEDYDVTLTFPEDEYVDDEIQQDLEFSLVDREVDWNAVSEFPADAEATGTTTVAPGTELDVAADSPNDQGGFVEFTSTEVTQGDDGNHEFAATFDDLVDEDPDVLFDLTVTDVTGEDQVEDTEEDIKLLAAGDSVPATFDVNAEAPSDVNVDGDASLDVTIENTGDASGTSNYTVMIDGEEVDSDELELDAGESVDKSYDFDTSAEGDVDWSVETDDDDQSDTLTVSTDEGENNDENGVSDENGTSDENGETDEGDEDGTPGFGVAVALFALLAAAMLALRQQN